MIDTDLIGIHGQTVVEVWPEPSYAIQRIALERTREGVVLVADGRILDRFALPEFDDAMTAFYDLDPLPLATLDDAMADFAWLS